MDHTYRNIGYKTLSYKHQVNPIINFQSILEIIKIVVPLST